MGGTEVGVCEITLVGSSKASLIRSAILANIEAYKMSICSLCCCSLTFSKGIHNPAEQSWNCLKSSTNIGGGSMMATSEEDEEKWVGGVASSSVSSSCSSSSSYSVSGGLETSEDKDRICLCLCSMCGLEKCTLYAAHES